MPFSIEAKLSTTGASDTTAAAATKAEAIRRAIDLQGQGYSKVRIVFNGRFYDPMELAAATID